MQIRVVNAPHLEARTQPEHEIASPNPARAQHLFLKPDFCPKAKFNKWVKTSMGAIWWGTRRTCPPIFLDGGHNMPCPPTFFSKGLYLERFQNQIWPLSHFVWRVFDVRSWAQFGGGHGRRVPPIFQVGWYNMPCLLTFSLQVLFLEKFQK